MLRALMLQQFMLQEFMLQEFMLHAFTLHAFMRHLGRAPNVAIATCPYCHCRRCGFQTVTARP
jgi:hypothetical protein